MSKDTKYTYVCPICGYANDRRLNAARHLVDGHIRVVSYEDAKQAGGVPYDHGANIWKHNPDIEQLTED